MSFDLLYRLSGLSLIRGLLKLTFENDLACSPYWDVARSLDEWLVARGARRRLNGDEAWGQRTDLGGGWRRLGAARGAWEPTAELRSRSAIKLGGSAWSSSCDLGVAMGETVENTSHNALLKTLWLPLFGDGVPGAIGLSLTRGNSSCKLSRTNAPTKHQQHFTPSALCVPGS
jgi:hypothetical protein